MTSKDYFQNRIQWYERCANKIVSMSKQYDESDMSEFDKVSLVYLYNTKINIYIDLRKVCRIFGKEISISVEKLIGMMKIFIPTF